MSEFKPYYVTLAGTCKASVQDIIEHVQALDPENASLTVRTNIDKDDTSKDCSFSAVLAALKVGKRARLPQWSEDVSIRLYDPPPGASMTHPYLYIEDGFAHIPWSGTHVDLLSENWEIVD